MKYKIIIQLNIVNKEAKLIFRIIHKPQKNILLHEKEVESFQVHIMLYKDVSLDVNKTSISVFYKPNLSLL